MSFGHADRRPRTHTPTPLDLMTDDLDLACPHCGDLCHPTLTNCEACGSNLFRYQRNTTAPARTPLDEQRAPGQQGATVMHDTPKCSCGGRGVCTVCVLASYENDPFSRSVDAVLHSMQPKSNVTPIRRHDRTGLNSPQTAYEQHRIQTELK